MASGREEGEGLGGGCGHEVWQTTATRDKREVEREGEREGEGDGGGGRQRERNGKLDKK